ncbi:MAG: efflux RND transporter periplasmic adaptor subunit [Nitrospiraceae bacterium]
MACNRNDSAGLSATGAAGEVPASPTAELTKRIEVSEVSYTTEHPALTLSGKIAYGDDRYSKISSPLVGRAVEVRVHLGDQIHAGDVLLVIDSPEITSVYSDYVKESSDLEFSTRAYELAKDLYETKALPQKDLKQAENDLIKARAEFRRAKERLLSLRVPAAELEKPLAQQRITSRFELKSPLDGTVVERSVTPGQSVGGDQDQVLFTVADLGKLQVIADLFERDLSLVKVSQMGSVNVEAYPGEDFTAVIASVGDLVDPVTRTIKVRAWVTNEQHRLKPEMFARLKIDVGDMGAFLTLPKEAVVETDGKHFVYLQSAPDRFERREVKVANVSADHVRILDGLVPGQRVVTKGAVLIKAHESGQG